MLNALPSALLVIALAASPAPETPDPRAPVVMTPAQQAELRAEMRRHLETVQAVLAALAADDIEAAGEAATTIGPGGGGAGHGQGHGQSRGQGGGPRHGFRQALPEAWFVHARPMHQQFRRIADEARGEGDRDRMLAALAEATAHCNACHASFRLAD
jgi:cytochrome c556